MTDHPATVAGRYWSTTGDGRIRCELCPRLCRLREGQRGLCYVRRAEGGRLVLTTYGRSSGFCIDPIEKKPLNHFLPGTPVLSFGTAGCNLACRYCQNWSISTSRQVDTLADHAPPAAVAEAAAATGCRSVAFTYNDPVIFLEYAVDVARACRERGLATVAVTAGEILPEPAREFFAHVDAANVDLKAFTERFYEKLCAGRLQPVLDTLAYLARETSVWLEITTLLIPGENDDEGELAAQSEWIRDQLGAETPLHFTAFHPDHRMPDHRPTPVRTLRGAREIALQAGLEHVYTGNVVDPEGQTTFCSGCGEPLVQRLGYELHGWRLDPEGCCLACGRRCPGRFEAAPGTWGGRRERVDMRRFAGAG